MIEKETDMTEQEIQKLIDRAIVLIPILVQVQPLYARMGVSMKAAIQKMLPMA